MTTYKTRSAAVQARNRKNKALSKTKANYCWVVSKLPSGKYFLERAMLR